MPLFSSVKPAITDPARNYAERILAVAVQLPAEAQTVFSTWLARYTQGGVPFLNKAGLFIWLAGLNPAHAEVEYRLILLEVAWLELAAEYPQLVALSKELAE